MHVQNCVLSHACCIGTHKRRARCRPLRALGSCIWVMHTRRYLLEHRNLNERVKITHRKLQCVYPTLRTGPFAMPGASTLKTAAGLPSLPPLSPPSDAAADMSLLTSSATPNTTLRSGCMTTRGREPLPGLPLPARSARGQWAMSGRGGGKAGVEHHRQSRGQGRQKTMILATALHVQTSHPQHNPYLLCQRPPAEPVPA